MSRAAPRTDLTAAEVRALLHYDASTGLFRWRVRCSQGVRAGDCAGSRSRQGYLTIFIRGHQYATHRLAWLHVYGTWPVGDIDHRNGNKADNRIANLRDADHSTNMQNRRVPYRRSRAIGPIGATQLSNGRWVAKIRVGGRLHHLGTFDSSSAAGAAYVAAKRQLHPGCTL